MDINMANTLSINSRHLYKLSENQYNKSMERLFHLISWPSPSSSNNLSQILIQLPFNAINCISSEINTFILSETYEIYTLSPSLDKLPITFKISSISCNPTAVLFASQCGKALIYGSDPTFSGVLGIPGIYSLRDPTEIPCLSQVFATSCSLGLQHAAIVSQEGCIYTWGSNFKNQCGKDTIEPSAVTNASIFCATKVICGDNCTAFLTNGGHIYTFGSIGKSRSCPTIRHRLRDPFILPEIENQFITDFTVGASFIGALNTNGEVFLYDECRALIKIPMRLNAKALSGCINTLYCIEKKTNYLYEWTVPESKEKGCGLNSVTGKVFNVRCGRLFGSQTESMYASVAKEATGRFLYQVENELVLKVANKETESLSPVIKRTSFHELSKEFSLNIDHFIITKNEATEKIVGVIKKNLSGVFNEIRDSALVMFFYRNAMRKNEAANRIALGCQETVRSVISESFLCVRKYSDENEYKKPQLEYEIRASITELSKKSKVSHAILCIFRLAEISIKHAVLSKISASKKPTAVNMKYSLLVFTSTLEKLFQKQKAQVFTLLLRKCLSKIIAKSAIRCVNNILAQRFKLSPPESPKALSSNNNKVYSIVKLCLVLQSVFEKMRTFSLLKGIKAFRTQLRNVSCFTPNIESMTFAESFEGNLNFSSYLNSKLLQFSSNHERKQLSLGIPETPYNELKKDLKNRLNNTDRRHSMYLNPSLTKLRKKEVKKAPDLRKAYDLKLKSIKIQNLKEKTGNNKRNEARRERIANLAKYIAMTEPKFLHIIKKHQLLCINSILLAGHNKQNHIELWKTNLYALGLHKFSLTIRAILKKSMLSLRLSNINLNKL